MLAGDVIFICSVCSVAEVAWAFAVEEFFFYFIRRGQSFEGRRWGKILVRHNSVWRILCRRIDFGPRGVLSELKGFCSLRWTIRKLKLARQ